MTRRPSFVMVVADDHAANAIGCYGSTINATPNTDRLAAEGMRFDTCGCANSLCAPSRASMLTGTYNHVNGVTTLSAPFDARQPSFPGMLQDAGYRTALVGKWHLGHGGVHDPRGFDHWEVLPDQGDYVDPEFLTQGGGSRVRPGYVTDVITDLALEWLADTRAPWCLLVHHKAPHRPWVPAARHARLYDDVEIPAPATFFDDYAGRAAAAAEARMRVGRDLNTQDVKAAPPSDLVRESTALWYYRRYIVDYLRCVAAIDENVGRLLDWLDSSGAAPDTVVIYTSDQGFFLGEHGWYDKRFMYAESLRMPLIVRYPAEVAPASVCDEIVLNVDFAPTILDLAGLTPPGRMQGRSLRALLRGESPSDWRRLAYYRYWEHLDSIHRVAAHCGVWTRDFKLVHYYGDGCGQPGASSERRIPEWELFDLARDPAEMESVFDDPAYADVAGDLRSQLVRQMRDLGDELPGSLADHAAAGPGAGGHG